MNNFRGRSREDVSMLQFVRQMRCSPNHLLSMFRREICSDPTIEGYRSSAMGSLYRIISLSLLSLSLLSTSLFSFFTRKHERRDRVETRILKQWTVNAIPGLPCLGVGVVPSNNRSSTIPS